MFWHIEVPFYKNNVYYNDFSFLVCTKPFYVSFWVFCFSVQFSLTSLRSSEVSCTNIRRTFIEATSTVSTANGSRSKVHAEREGMMCSKKCSHISE